MNMGIDQIKKIAEPILKRHRVKFAGVFGSYARGEADEKSDVDLLVGLSEPLSLIELIGLERELSETLGVKTEVVTEKSLHRYIAPYVFQDLKLFYGKR
jgi:predicted nucleotidyltransferase